MQTEVFINNKYQQKDEYQKLLISYECIKHKT